MSVHFEAARNRWLVRWREGGRNRPKTLRAYAHDLKLFFSFLAGGGRDPGAGAAAGAGDEHGESWAVGGVVVQRAPGVAGRSRVPLDVDT